jgi:hypothetical protein
MGGGGWNLAMYSKEQHKLHVFGTKFTKKSITKTSWVTQATYCCCSGKDHGGFYELNMYFRQWNNKLM